MQQVHNFIINQKQSFNFIECKLIYISKLGFWAKEVGALAGINLPLVPLEHQYLVTSSVPEIQALKNEFPVLRHIEGSFYMRQERDGFLVGPYEKASVMKLCQSWATDGVPKGELIFSSRLRINGVSIDHRNTHY